MRLHRFYISENIEGEKIFINDEALSRQLKNVLRLKSGDRIVVFDGSGDDFECEIVSFGELKLIEKRKSIVLPKKDITLFVSLIKKDKMEWVMQKGTEIGVSHFVPIISERSEKKDLNIERARKIIIEACEQSGRSTIPTLSDPISLSSAISSAKIPLFALHSFWDNISH